MLDLTTYKKGETVFIITNDSTHDVEEAVVLGTKHEFYECDLTAPKFVIRSRLRMPSEVYKTRDDAQKDLDYLTNYIAYRMASHTHRMK